MILMIVCHYILATSFVILQYCMMPISCLLTSSIIPDFVSHRLSRVMIQYIMTELNSSAFVHILLT